MPIARRLTRWPHLDVTAGLLVAPAEDASHPRAKPFTPVPEQPLPVPTTLVASQNDPWMRQSRVRNLASQWQSRWIDVSLAGPERISSRFDPGPFGFALRDDGLDRVAAARGPQVPT